MKKSYPMLVIILMLLWSCGGGNEATSTDNSTQAKPKSMLADEASSDPMQDKGIGPVTSVTLGAEVDAAMAAKGKEIYEKMCTACHKPTEKFIGPAQKGVLERRSPEWIMNMILNPTEMVQKDPIAKDLLKEFNGSPMANQNLTEEDARAVLEYFRTL